MNRVPNLNTTREARTEKCERYFLVLCALVVAWTLSPRDASSHGAVTTTVLFDREIVRILSNRCVSCHMEGGLSFPLSTYEQTWVRGRTIRSEILRRHMPPWSAVSGYGQFANDNGLTLRETQFLVSWVEGLGPRNAGTVFLNVSDPRNVAPTEVRATAHVGHWQAGEPDLRRIVTANTVAAGRPDFVQRVVVDLGLTSARRIRALEFMPGDRRVVRAAVFSVEKTGQWLGAWTPWYSHVKLPDGVAHLLPAGSRIVAEIHYRAAAEPVVDRSMLGLFFAETQPVPRPTADLILQTGGSGRGKLRASMRIAADTNVWALHPEALPGISSLDVTARMPDGRTEVLLLAKDVRAEWPTPYILAKPIRLPRGTQLSLAARVASENGASGRAMRMVVAKY